MTWQLVTLILGVVWAVVALATGEKWLAKWKAIVDEREGR